MFNGSPSPTVLLSPRNPSLLLDACFATALRNVMGMVGIAGGDLPPASSLKQDVLSALLPFVRDLSLK